MYFQEEDALRDRVRSDVNYIQHNVFFANIACKDCLYINNNDLKMNNFN